MLNFSFGKSTTMTSLLTMGMILHSSQAALTKPMDRYTPWASVKSTVRAAAQTIGYSETSWNKFSQSIEAKSWFTINQGSPELMDEVAIIGINEESWDCYIVSHCPCVCEFYEIFPFFFSYFLWILRYEFSRTVTVITSGAN
jgi:hypothetical protein